MKPQELRIGNIVLMPAGILGNKEPRAIERGSQIDNCEIEQWEGIPLTEEILLKCGFVKNGDYIFDHESGVVFNAPTDWNNLRDYPTEIDVSRSVMGWNPEQIIIRCVYLHELQNKFYAIEGEELVVNI